MTVTNFVPTDKPVVVVLISQVPNLTYLRVDRKTGEVDRSDPERSLHRNDREPVEAALQIKDETGAHVVVIAVDHENAQDGIREAFAMGADVGVLLMSQAMEHSDAIARANLFAQAVRLLTRVDVVFVGTETMEPDWSLVGGALSGILEWPIVTGGRGMRFDGDRLTGDCMFGAEWVNVETDKPAVVSVRPRSYTPRWPTTWSVFDAYRARDIHAWNLVDMDIDGRTLARMASHTETRAQRVIRKPEREHEVFTDPPEQSARVIGKRLAREGYLGGF